MLQSRSNDSSRLKSWINLFCCFRQHFNSIDPLQWIAAISHSVVALDGSDSGRAARIVFGESRSRFGRNFNFFTFFFRFLCYRVSALADPRKYTSITTDNQQLFTVLVFSRLVFKVVLFNSFVSFISFIVCYFRY